MQANEEFLRRELAWVRIVRQTKKPDQLHLVEPAVKREREILTILGELSPVPFGGGAGDATPAAPAANAEVAA